MFVIPRTLLSFARAHFRASWSCNSQLTRKFNRTIPTTIKMYMEHENMHAYNIMEIKGYVKNVSNNNNIVQNSLSEENFNQLIKEDWSKKSPKEFFEYFSLFANYCAEHKIYISNKIFDDFIDNVTDNLRHATDQELASVFYSLNKFPEPDSVRTRNHIEVWVALDDVCLHRLKSWSFDQRLFFLSLFYMTNVSRVSDYTYKALLKLTSKYTHLSPEQLVQTMFYIGIYRKSPKEVHNLEIHLNTNFDKLSIDELAIIAMGFFKSKTPIRNMDIINKIIDRIIENPEDINEVTLAALVKIIRYSMKITVDDRIYRLIEVLQFEVDRLSTMCNVHIALVGTATLTLHKECLTKIANRVLFEPSSKLRLKDLERLVLTYATFDFIPPTKESLIQKVLDELRSLERQTEINNFGRSFVSCLEYLGHLGIYPTDLMDKALSRELLQKTYGKYCYHYGRNILAVHNTAKIFCGGADINYLSDKEAAVIAKKYTDYVPDAEFKKQYNVSERMFLDVREILEDIRGGRNYVVGDHILTHHQRGDIIICNGPDGQPLPVIDTFSQQSFGLIRKPPDNNTWIVLIIAGRNAIIKGSDRPTGHFQAKVRELKALGYHPALVPWSIYSAFETKEQKTKFIQELINKAIK